MPFTFSDAAEIVRRPTWADLDRARAERVAHWTAQIAATLPDEPAEKVGAAARWMSQWVLDAAMSAISQSPYEVEWDVKMTLLRFSAAAEPVPPTITDDTIVTVEGGPCTWGSFVAANADGLGADELAEIKAALERGETYEGGGGAGANFAVSGRAA